MNEKALRILEYHKIINLLVDKATSEPGKDVCRNLLPMTDIKEIEEAQMKKQKRRSAGKRNLIFYTGGA